jgi:hypothetical protein
LKEVYHIVKIDNLSIAPNGFSATAYPQLTIKDGLLRKMNDWEFGGSWGWTRLSGNALTGSYGSSWEIWLDPNLVRKAEQLTLENKTDEVMEVLYGK